MVKSVKSVKKSTKKSCARGNVRGSVVVKSHSRKSGKKVLCYRKRKSVRK